MGRSDGLSNSYITHVIYKVPPLRPTNRPESIRPRPCLNYDDDGNELNPDLVPKPGLCLACIHDEPEDELDEIVCVLARFDQEKGKDFVCLGFQPRRPVSFQEETTWS